MMETPVRIFNIRQAMGVETVSSLTSMSRDDICFFHFLGGNSSDTNRLAEQLYRIKGTGVFLIGIFRFPFRFEGKKRLQTAIYQYYQMKDLCDAVTYFHSDGMLELLEGDTSVQDANRFFRQLTDRPAEAVEELIGVAGDMNIDVLDVKTFLRGAKGPFYIHVIEDDSFDEPLKYLLTEPCLPKDYADGAQLMMNMGYSRGVDMMTFQQMNLRLNDLFHKADLFKLGTYCMDEPGRRFRITVLVNGLKDPFPRPEVLHRLHIPKLWLKRQLQNVTRKAFDELPRREHTPLAPAREDVVPERQRQA